MSKDPHVTDYIERQADFARPILEHLREMVHAACPEAEETLKWGMPTFLYRGEQLAGMAAFKAHATFGYRRGSLVLGDDGAQPGAMGQFGRLTSIADLPDRDVLLDLTRKAMALTDAGVKAPRAGNARPPLAIPDDLAAALADNDAARSTFEGFPQGARRDYLDWINDAKRAETRARRIAEAVEWLSEGKKRHWKYDKRADAKREA